MKRLLALITIVYSYQAWAVDIASCSNPVGKGYFPELKIIGKKNSGWSEERITGGVTKVIKTGDNEYDVLYVDASKEVNSARNDGGRVLLISKGQNEFSLLVVYPGQNSPGATVEVYTFLKDNSGKHEYMHTLSRAGEDVRVTKASVMRGDCSYIDFGAL